MKSEVRARKTPQTGFSAALPASLTLVIITLSLILGLLAVAGSPADASSAPELIVKYKDNMRPSAARAARQSVRSIRGVVAPARSIDSDENYQLLRVDPAADANDVIAALEAEPAVEYVEINQRARALETWPKSPAAGQNWRTPRMGLSAALLALPNDPLLERQWNFSQIKAQSAWRLTSNPGRDVVVAVLDTGVAYENRSEDGVSYRSIPDLEGTSFVPGYDFVHNDSHPNDDQGHGTHVAGVIAQTTNNGYGPAGLAYGAKIMPIKVLDKNGWGTAFDIARAIRWAADRGAKVINLSLGLDSFSRAVEDALEYARNKKNVTIVAASGNEGLRSGYSGGLIYPASSTRVISVGATGYDKRRAAYSQYGGGLDLAAPGGTDLDQNRDGFVDGILQQTITDGDPSTYGYYWITGTSQAAPHVSAAAAMLIARGFNTPGEVYRALTRSADDLGAAGHDKYYGYGLLDLYGALTYKRPSTKWYFAEGYTADRFNTKILIVNPANVAAKVRAYFSKPGGSRVIRDYTIRPGRRFTIQIDSIPGLAQTGVSTVLESTNGVGIVADRTMYFNYRGRKGGHTTVGAVSPSRQWYLAEGCTDRGFETNILIFNPNALASKVEVAFTKPDGGRIVKRYRIPARGRRKIIVDDIAALRAAEFATKVDVISGPGVVVERSMYFAYGDKNGGHSTVGATTPQAKWLFAEGTTVSSFETWILVQNPGSKNAIIAATFSRPDGLTIVRKYKLRPGRRRTISVNSLPGMGETDVAAKIESTNGVKVVAERAMYFNHGKRSGGHVSLGVPAPAHSWYFADGFTGGDYETWILIYNPRAGAAKITVQFMRENGMRVIKKLTVPARSRRTISVDKVSTLSSTRVSAKVFSTNGVPVVAGKAVYFGHQGWNGGHATVGYSP